MSVGSTKPDANGTRLISCATPEAAKANMAAKKSFMPLLYCAGEGFRGILARMRLAIVGLFFLSCAVVSGADAAPQYSGELIFPLEHWHNHSSSIVELPNGNLLVCWFHGSGERTADDVLIQAARWTKSTGKW